MCVSAYFAAGGECELSQEARARQLRHQQEQRQSSAQQFADILVQDPNDSRRKDQTREDGEEARYPCQVPGAQAVQGTQLVVDVEEGDAAHSRHEQSLAVRDFL